jgi:murein DD-endopeptidase MepM/ murein hydrolase activator NlpD
VLVERQIMLLYQRIGELEQKTDWYLDASNKSQQQMKVEQAKLDNKQKTNAQKMQTINQNIASACVDVLTKEKSVKSIIGQVSAMKQVAIDNQRATDQMAQIGSGNEFIQGVLSYNKDKISNLNALITTKRQEAYQYLQDVDNKNLKFGNLVETNKSHPTVVNVDKQGIAWADPCVYTTISSPFGYRIHPVYKVRKMHNGVDLTNVSNTPIYATRSGVVVDSSYDSSSGYHVVIDHLDGYKSCYLHLRKQSDLKVGDVVIIGDYVGAMGTTGVSTGTHLHFGISYNDKWVNPMNYIYNH